ncbi:MAG: IclR family transcriptional regulator [Proteobacteria bacterium]|nr:IclR family transcriptional regulator [Burkholderiales bacterium]
MPRPPASARVPALDSDAAPPKIIAKRAVARTSTAARSAGLRRGLEILSLFSEGRPELGVSEVARELGVHKSRIHRAIKTLEDMCYLRRDPRTRRYCLGYKAFEIGALAGRHSNTMSWARGRLRALAARFEATVSLRLVDDTDLLIVDMIETDDDPELHVPTGARIPLNYGAGGQVRSAFLSDARIRKLIELHGLPRYTLKSISTEREFLRAVQATRARGYAISEGETVPGSFSVAAPIVDREGTLKAVLVGARRKLGFTRSQINAFAKAAVETADHISAHLPAQSGAVAVDH